MTNRPIPVILSGGAGSRLWPVSRTAMPKPFLTLPDGESLALKTLQRAAVIGNGDVVTVTGAGYHVLTETTAALPAAPRLAMHYLLEPMGRNTAPAIAAAAHLVAKRWGPTQTLLVMPADHLITDIKAFDAAVSHAHALATEGYLVTFGIEPEHPETGYGYIRRGASLGEHGYAVDRFVEKPDLERARAFVADGLHAWNAGIFCFRADRLLEELARHAPDMAHAVALCWNATESGGPVVNLDAKTFAATPAESIDYAVMERSDRTAVVPCAIGWSDIGSWAAIRELTEPDAEGNRLTGHVEAIAARNCFVQSDDRVVGIVGVEGLVVIDTPDALLIAHQDQTQGVKQIVDRLKIEDHPSLRLPITSTTDWGTAHILDQGAFGTVRRLEVRPDAPLVLDSQRTLTVLSGSLHDESGYTMNAGSTVNHAGSNAVFRAGPDGAVALETTFET